MFTFLFPYLCSSFYHCLDFFFHSFGPTHILSLPQSQAILIILYPVLLHLYHILYLHYNGFFFCYELEVLLNGSFSHTIVSGYRAETVNNSPWSHPQYPEGALYIIHDTWCAVIHICDVGWMQTKERRCLLISYFL